MENATKALLIAAAVLVAIIIISLTLAIVRQGTESINNADLSEAEQAQFNQKFTVYEGSNVSVSEVNALLSTVLNHNQNEATNKTNRFVTVTKTASSKTTTLLASNASSIVRQTGNSRYTVTCTLTKGIVTSINIK